MPKLLRNTGKDFSFLNEVIIKLYSLYLTENTTNVHVEQQKTSSGGEWSVPSVIFFLVRIGSFRRAEGTWCTFQKSRVGVASPCWDPSGWKLLTWFPPTTHLPKEFCVHLNSASGALNSWCFSWVFSIKCHKFKVAFLAVNNEIIQA